MVFFLTVARRLLLIPSALSAGVLGLATFHYTGNFLFGLCPPERIEDLGSELDYIGGRYACATPWYSWAEAFTFIVSATVASSLFVLLPALLEPTERFFVAVMAYAIGITLTSPLFLIGLFSPALLLTVVTLLSVGLGCVWVVKRSFGVGQRAASLFPKWLSQ